MRQLDISLQQKHFSLIWKSLHAREQALLNRVEKYGEDSEEAGLALNDLAFLRLYRKELKKEAEEVFNQNVFSLSDEAYTPG